MTDVPRRIGIGDALLAASALLIGPIALLLLVAFLVGIDLSLVSLAMSDATRLLFDGGLCLLFFVQHSVMLRRSFRSWLARALSTRCHAALYAVASGVALAALVLLWQRTGEPLYETAGAVRWILHGVQLLALSSTLWAWQALGLFDPLGVTSLKRGVDLPLAPLTVRGPYRWVRHPLYFAFLVATWTVPVLTTDRLLFNVLWTVWIVVGCILEERDLVAAHGEVYRAYRRRVPMLIPRPRSGSHSERSLT